MLASFFRLRHIFRRSSAFDHFFILVMTIVEQSHISLPTPEPSSSESEGSSTEKQPHDLPMTQGGAEAERTLFELFGAQPKEAASSALSGIIRKSSRDGSCQSTD